MPALSQPKKKEIITLPPRDALLGGKADVLVVGGGPSGLGAAIGAAASGASVILVERYGFLGGNATAALVMPLMSFFTKKREVKTDGQLHLLPEEGTGRAVIAGALKQFLDKLILLNGAIFPSQNTGYTVPFDPEIFKWAALELLNDAGVHFLFHSFASETIRDGQKIKGIVFETKSGPIVIEADRIIDATGDGDIAARSGTPYEIGRAEDGLVQPMTLMFRMGEFEKRLFESYVEAHPDQWRGGVLGLWDLIKIASEKGELNLARENLLFFATPHPKEVSVNSTRVKRTLGVNVWDLTHAEYESRKQMKEIVSFLQRYVPGFQNAYAIQSGVQVGVRETRRIVGEYILTAEDVLSARKFDDAIARSTYPIDIHNPEGVGTVMKHVPEGDYYEIPLRCLIPQEIENLLVAGRCISGTHEAHSSYRVMPVSMATGQAAGVCAALSLKEGVMPRKVPYQQIKLELIRQGAILT